MAGVSLRDAVIAGEDPVSKLDPTVQRHESLYRTVDAHVPHAPYELAFAAGRMVTNVKATAASEWLFGRLDGRNGLFLKAKSVHVSDEAWNLVPAADVKAGKAKDKDKDKKAKNARSAADAQALASLASSLAGENRIGLVLVACALASVKAGEEPLFALLPGDVVGVEGAVDSDGFVKAQYAGAHGRLPLAVMALIAGPEAQALLVLDAPRAALRARAKRTPALAAAAAVGGAAVDIGSADGDGSDGGSDSDSAAELAVESLGPVLYDGTMDKKGGSRHSWKKRFCHLHASALVYRVKAKDKKIKGAVRLAGAALEVLEHESAQARFAINTPKRRWIFRCKKDAQRAEWMAAIQAAIDAATTASSGAAP